MLMTLRSEDFSRSPRSKEEFYHSIWGSVKRMRTSVKQVKKNVGRLKKRVDISKQEQEYLNYLEFIKYNNFSTTSKSIPMNRETHNTLSHSEMGRPKTEIDIHVKRIDYYVGFHDIRLDFSQYETRQSESPQYPSERKKFGTTVGSPFPTKTSHSQCQPGSPIRKPDSNNRLNYPGKKSRISPEI